MRSYLAWAFFTGTALITSATVATGCGDAFTSCQAQRTCPSGGAGGAAGDDSDADPNGGSDDASGGLRAALDPTSGTGGTFASSPNPGDAGGSEGGDDGTGTSGGNDGQERPEGEQGEEPSEPEPIQAHVCEPDTFGTDGEPESCTQWKTCLPGEYVSKPGTPTTDRECEPCAEGYSTTENAPSCTPGHTARGQWAVE